MKYLVILLALFLGGCAQFGSKPLVLADGSQISERALIATEQHKAEAACYKSRAVAMPESPTTEQVLAFAVASMATQNARPCSGTNSNDVAIAKTKARWGFAGAATGQLVGFGKAKAAFDFGKTLATKSGNTTYNTDINTPNQNIDNSGGGGAEGGAVGQGGELGEGEEFGLASDSGGTGGSGGGVSDNASLNANTINIGGNVAISGNDAAAGDVAQINGDGSSQASITDSELKQSPLGANLEGLDNSNGEGFNDADGGNGVLDF
jgi:hypothetical protein